jgi:putative membrane protein
MKLLIRLGLMVVAVWLTFRIVPGLGFDGEAWVLVVLALLVGLANAIVIPILKVFALPLRVMTLGLATLAINVAVMFALIILAGSLDVGITSDGALANILGALVLTVLSSVISFLVRD